MAKFMAVTCVLEGNGLTVNALINLEKVVAIYPAEDDNQLAVYFDGLKEDDCITIVDSMTSFFTTDDN